MPLLQGQVLNNRYRIVRLIEQGGFGAIYRAWDTVLERVCALKENLDASSEAARQFEREAKILADLAHPNLPRVTDHFFIPGQGQYLVMDLVEGQDLQSMLDDHGGPLGESRVLTWIEQVCDALAYLHAQQPAVIHRDIKPANIQITAQGKAMLVDFGIAKVFDAQLRTTIGARAVTPGFSPYEQYGHGTTDERTDIYALGATLYTLLTGQEPPESVQRVVRDPLVPAKQLNPLLSDQVCAVIERAMQMDPVRRYRSAAKFKAALPGQIQPQSKGTVSAPVKGAVQSLPWIWIGVLGLFIMVMLLTPLALKARKNSLKPGNTLPVTGITPTVTTAPQKSTISPTSSATVEVHAPTEVPEPDRPIHTPAVYTVQPGDVCVTIAHQFGLSIESIIAINHLDSDCTILSGQTLLLAEPQQISQPALSLTSTVNSVQFSPGEISISPIDGMETVYIPPGAFLMGSLDSDLSASINEKPQTWVYLDAFWIDKTEVTNAMYARCVALSVCPPPAQNSSKTRFGYFSEPAYANYPVLYVSWYDAQTYCEWAGRRLPSEAEWEKAARGFDGRTYPWGELLPSALLANFDNQVGDTTAVGSYPEGASPYGALDMVGNVREWVADWYGDNYYAIMPVANPLGPSQGDFRVLRGGSWFSAVDAVRAASRLWNYPEAVFESSGFRCASQP